MFDLNADAAAGPESDREFDRRLQRLFCEAPPRPDAELFSAQLRERLDRAWTLRRFLIGAAGAGGGAVALWQLAGSAMVARFDELSRLPSLLALRQAMGVLADAPALRALPFSGEIVWLMGGLLVLAAGLVATRMVDEF